MYRYSQVYFVLQNYTWQYSTNMREIREHSHARFTDIFYFDAIMPHVGVLLTWHHVSMNNFSKHLSLSRGYMLENIARS